METLRVLAVGSCRVFRPLRAMHEAGRIDLLNHDDGWWFTHSAGEADQYVHALAGLAEIPTDVRPMVCETPLQLPDDLIGQWRLDADVIVVEVSTMKALTLDGLRLNYHLVWGYADRAGLDPRAVLQGRDAGIPAGDPLERMAVGVDSPDDVARHILAIRALTGVPVLTVDHLHAVMPNGELAPERATIRQTLQNLQVRHAVPAWSSRPFVEEHGPGTLQDHNHWAPEWESRVGEHIVSHAMAALGNRPIAVD